MKTLTLLFALLTFSTATFADGSVICDDRTTTDALEAYELSAGETDCREGFTKNGNSCVPNGSASGAGEN